MGNYPDVIPGQRVNFSANRENEINHRLNASNGFSAGATNGHATPNVRLQVWNASGSTVQAGKAVNIAVTGSTMCGDAFPFVAFSDVELPFGVLTRSLASNEIGDIMVSGPAIVAISGSTGGYAKPVSGGAFLRGDEGCKILNLSGGTNAVVMLGDYKHDSGGGGGGGSVGSPDYLSPLVEIGDVLAQTFYPGTAYPEGQAVWLIGNLTAFPDEDGQIVLSVRVVIRNGGNFESVYLTDFRTQQNSYIDKFSVPVSLLISADYEFEIDILQGTGNDFTSELAIYPCI